MKKVKVDCPKCGLHAIIPKGQYKDFEKAWKESHKKVDVERECGLEITELSTGESFKATWALIKKGLDFIG